jgi:hypothetical protein
MVWSRIWRANRYRRPLVHLRIYAKDKPRRLAKYRRDRAAAMANPAWRGQAWVTQRYGAEL